MDLLQPGQKLSINIQKEDKLVEIIGTISQVMEDRLIIELPPYFMRYIEYLDAGKKLTIKVFSKVGTIDFNTVIISSPLEDDFSIEYDINAIKFTPEEEFEGIQDIETIKITRGEETITARTIEIATSFIKIYANDDFEINENISCKLILPPDYGTISFKATITDRDKLYDNEYKIVFYSMNEHDRQTLLYYMYVYSNNIVQE